MRAWGFDLSPKSGFDDVSFLILRLGAPTGILRGGSPVFKRFGPLNLLTFSGGGPHPVISRMSLSVFLYPSEPNAYRRLWEALFGLLMPVTAAWTGATSESSQWLLHVAYYLLLTCNLRLCEALFGPFMSIASTPVAYSGHGSSQWLFHTVYLIYANWAL